MGGGEGGEAEGVRGGPPDALPGRGEASGRHEDWGETESIEVARYTPRYWFGLSVEQDASMSSAR